MEMRWLFAILILVSLFLLVITISVIFPFLDHIMPGIMFSTEPSEWASIGDFFGGILSPILGLLSLFGVLVTIMQQNKSIEQTSKQIALSFDEVRKSAKAQERQVEAQEKQIEELQRKRKIDGLVSAITSLLNEADRLLYEDVKCYVNRSKTRKLKAQLIEVSQEVSASGNNDRFIDFKKIHEYRLGRLRSMYSLISDAIIELNEISDSPMAKYFSKRAEELKEIILL